MPKMANNSGYKVINGTRPAIDTVNAAKAEISAEKLRYLGSKSSLLGFETLGWGDNCERLLHDGLDVSLPCYNNMTFADLTAMER